MVLALYALALAMGVGGLVAIYSGSDIIVMERGWTMVIAGSVVAASGALLAGIATVIARLQDLEAEFVRLADRLPQSDVPSISSGPRIPEIKLPIEPTGAAPARQADLEITPEPLVPRTPPAAPPPAGPLPTAEAEPADVAASEPKPEEVAPAENEFAAITAEPKKPDQPLPPIVVGTYNSGGNYYVMYSDGSIEAETPAGKFRFNSLDELKEFIAAGGDKADRRKAGTDGN